MIHSVMNGFAPFHDGISIDSMSLLARKPLDLVYYSGSLVPSVSLPFHIFIHNKFMSSV